MNTKCNIESLLQNQIICIPEIQRDYAQGRKSEQETIIRNDLLNDIFTRLVNGGTLQLNYIYGVPISIEMQDEESRQKRLELIDGQQRITTLYLLYLYFGANIQWPDEISKKQYNKNCQNFTYEARTTSRDFCIFLHNHTECLGFFQNALPSSLIKRSKDYYKKWLNDPTVAGMMVMLDAICDKANKTMGQEDPASFFKKCYENLRNISFEFISLDEFKRSEELYSTMNSRGRQLTWFERFKSELLKKSQDIGLDSDSINLDERINDCWVPLFWKYAKKMSGKPEDNYDLFMTNFFVYIIKMLYMQDNKDAKKIPERDDTSKWLLNVADSDKGRFSDYLSFIDFSMQKCCKVISDNEGFFERFFFNINSNDLLDPKYKNDIDHYKKNKDEKLLIKDTTANHNLFNQICSSENRSDYLVMLLLWAYIQYAWRVWKNELQENDKNLKKFFIIMRCLWREAFDSYTPESLDKSAVDGKIHGSLETYKRIISTPTILNDGRNHDHELSMLFLTLLDEKPNIIRVLNNPLVSGHFEAFPNLFIQRSNAELGTFADNLDYLYENCGIGSLKAINKVFKYKDGRGKTNLYIPYSFLMLQSLFSKGNWNRPETGQPELIERLCRERIDNSLAPGYGFKDFFYYVQRYPKFFSHKRVNKYCVFVSDDPELGFDAQFEYTTSEAKTDCPRISPFILCAYKPYFDFDHGAQRNVGQLIKNTYMEYVSENCVSLKKEENAWVFSITSNGEAIRRPWDEGCDLIEFIKRIINPDGNPTHSLSNNQDVETTGSAAVAESVGSIPQNTDLLEEALDSDEALVQSKVDSEESAVEADEREEKSNSKELSMGVILYCTLGHAKAKGVRRSEKSFVVFSGSIIDPKEPPTSIPKIRELRQTYADRIVNNKLICDIEFSSPSQAAKFVCAYSVSGNEAWKEQDPHSESNDNDDRLPIGTRVKKSGSSTLGIGVVENYDAQYVCVRFPNATADAHRLLPKRYMYPKCIEDGTLIVISDNAQKTQDSPQKDNVEVVGEILKDSEDIPTDLATPVCDDGLSDVADSSGIDWISAATFYHYKCGNDQYRFTLRGLKRIYKESISRSDPYDVFLENTTPEILSFNGCVFTQHDWVNLIQAVASYLVHTGAKPIRELLELRSHWSEKVILFSKEKRTNFRKIDGCDELYVNANHTAVHSCWIICDLLDAFGVDRNTTQFYIHRPSSAEREHFQKYMKQKFRLGFSSFLMQSNTEEETKRIIDRLDVLDNSRRPGGNLLFRVKCLSYASLFLFDDKATMQNYLTKCSAYLNKNGLENDALLIEKLRDYYMSRAFLSDYNSWFADTIQLP